MKNKSGLHKRSVVELSEGRNVTIWDDSSGKLSTNAHPGAGNESEVVKCDPNGFNALDCDVILFRYFNLSTMTTRDVHVPDALDKLNSINPRELVASRIRATVQNSSKASPPCVEG